MGARSRTGTIGAALVAVAAVLLSGCSALSDGADPGGPAGRSPGSSVSGSVSSSSSSAPSSAAGRPVAHRPATTPCTRNHRAQWIFVSLKRQHMWLCERAHVTKDVPITSGMVGPYTETPTGHYRIQGLNRNTVLTLNTGATYPVKYWIPFDAPLFGFHDSSWQKFPYGSAAYRTDGSHGCVHVPLAAIRFLYRWAQIGTPVTIRA